MTTAFRLEPWGLVEVTGPDATAFLQALVSQDLTPVPEGASVASLLLHPQGKLDAVFRATRTSEGWWCDTEPDAAGRLAASLARFRIRVKAEIADRTAGTARVAVVADPGDALPPPPASVPAGVRVLPVDRPGWQGFDVVGPVAVVDAWAAGEGLRFAGADGYELRRIAAGIPRQGVDVDDRTIPQEAFLELDAVSFTKGCFLGQELVCRIDSRGHVNRHLRRLELAGDVVPGPGSVVRADDAEVGEVTSAAALPEGGVVALAMVRREVVPPAVVEVVVGGESLAATVLPGPDAD